jgi:hypothetical protein
MPADTSAVGKANFGFVAKYKKGSNQVDGNTEFQFNAGGLNFKSTMYESGTLVISGRKATYRGNGTNNGIPGYKFVVVAIDGNWNNQTDPDRYRIKITRIADNEIVYDNQMGSPENGEDATILGGGSIVIHDKKNKEFEIIPVDVAPAATLEVYPNPTRDKATFRFVPQADSKARLEIYHLNGSLVHTLYEGDVTAGTLYEFVYQPADRHPGMLLYRLILDNKVINGKLVIQQ